MRACEKTRGFTLIELLVVVAIIVALIAMLMPSLGRARAQARTVKCSTHIRSLYIGTTYYASECNNIIVRAAEKTSDMGTVDWIRILNGRGYLGEDRSIKSTAYTTTRFCPDVDRTATTLSSYILSWTTSGTYRDPAVANPVPVYIRFQEFTSPGNTFFFADYIFPPIDGATHTVGWTSDLTRLGPRHGEGSNYFNVAWVDGHISLEKHVLPRVVWAGWMFSSTEKNPY